MTVHPLAHLFDGAPAVEERIAAHEAATPAHDADVALTWLLMAAFDQWCTDRAVTRSACLM